MLSALFQFFGQDFKQVVILNPGFHLVPIIYGYIGKNGACQSPCLLRIIDKIHESPLTDLLESELTPVPIPLTGDGEINCS